MGREATHWVDVSVSLWRREYEGDLLRLSGSTRKLQKLLRLRIHLDMGILGSF